MAGQGLTVASESTAPRGGTRLLRGSGAVWLLALPMAFLAVFLVVPLVLIFATALTEKGVAGSVAEVTQPLFVSALLRTFLLATVVTVACWTVGLAYSTAMVVARGWVRGALLAVLFLTFWISLLVRTYGWIVLFQPRGVLYDLLTGLHLLDGPVEVLQTPWAMYPGMIHIMLPYMVLPMYAALLGLDPRQVAVAESLGARPLRVLRQVVLPQIRAGAIAGVVLVFVLSLGFYVTPAFLGGPDQLTLGTIVQREFGETFDLGAASAMGGTLLLLVAALFLVANRLFGVTRHWGGTRV